MLFSNGWFCITTQLFIKISFRPRTAGWYVVTNGKIFVWVFFLCWRANLLSSKRTPVRDLSMKLLGYPRALRRSLKFERHSSKVVCEEFVLRSLVASPLMKPQNWTLDQVAVLCFAVGNGEMYRLAKQSSTLTVEQAKQRKKKMQSLDKRI